MDRGLQSARLLERMRTEVRAPSDVISSFDLVDPQ
jgi:hypothetical protein